MKKTVNKLTALAFVSSLFLAGNASALTLDYFTGHAGDAIYMLIFGTGLAGLAGLRRKKGHKEA